MPDDKVNELLSKISDSSSEPQNQVEENNDIKIEIQEEEEPLIIPDTTYKVLGIPKESLKNEKRVSITPKVVKKFVQ